MSTRKLKQLLLYKERMPHTWGGVAPSVADNQWVLSESQAEEILNYMEKAHVLLEFVSPMEDPFNAKEMVRNVLFTDGTYIWDGVIVNWVKRNRIRLPPDFIRHVSERHLADVMMASADLIDPIELCNSAEEVVME